MARDLSDEPDPADPFWHAVDAAPRPVHASGCPQPLAPIRSVHGLGVTVQALLGVSILVLAFKMWRIVVQRSLLEKLRADPASVTYAQGVAVDDLVSAASIVALAMLVGTGVVWIVWMWRLRSNVDAWGGRHQRRAKGWVIGAWFCPLVNLYFPYMIMKDIADDTDADPDPGALGSGRRSRPLMVTWWATYLASAIGGWVVTQFGRRFDGATTDRQTTIGDALGVATGEIVASALSVVAAGLAIVVVTRLTAAQTGRISATSWAG